MNMITIRFYIWRIITIVTKKLHISMLLKKKVGLKNLNYNLLVTQPQGYKLLTLNPELLYLGPDFLNDSYTLLDCPLLESPHFELVECLSNNNSVKQTGYYKRFVSGTLDWRYLHKPHLLSYFETQFGVSKKSIMEETYRPVKIYCVNNRYYIYDGKHRAAMCALMNKQVRCELIDEKIAFSGVFSYMFNSIKDNKIFYKHQRFNNNLSSRINSYEG